MSLTPKQRAEIVRLYSTPQISVRSIAARVGVAVSTVLRVARSAGLRRKEGP